MKKIIAVDVDRYTDKDPCEGCCFYTKSGGCLYPNTYVDPKLRDCTKEAVIYKEVEDDITLATTTPIQPTSFVFNNPTNEYAGELYWEDNELKFKGDIHETAKSLFKEVSKMFKGEI